MHSGIQIFGDRGLLRIAKTAPGNEWQLLAVQGIGSGIVKESGAHMLRLIRASLRLR